MTNTPKLPSFLLITALLQLALLTSAQAFGRSEYRAGEITIEKIEKQDDGSLQISYHAMAETIYYCPGVNAKTTKQGLELTFVRSHFKKKAKADYLADPPKKDTLIRTVTVPATGQTVFIKSSDQLVQIFPQPEAE